MYTIDTIIKIVNGTVLQEGETLHIVHLVFDSRNISFPQSSLFFALHTSHQDGHQYLSDAYSKGVRCFIVDKGVNLNSLPGATVVKVVDTLKSLQELAAFHRTRFKIPVIGITGSNGKTIVKEWLYQLLHHDYNIVRSPKSFNSQIGVPLSVWQMNESHSLSIFEAGISKPGEMNTLADIIHPSVGVLTNIGEAHGENFKTDEEKLLEKLKLFGNASALVYNADDELIDNTIRRGAFAKYQNHTALINWGHAADAKLQLHQVVARDGRTMVDAVYDQQSFQLVLPFTDTASIQNCITCIGVMLYLGYKEDIIQQRLLQLHTVDMRLQLKHGINGCTIINDSYSADLTSLQLALQFLSQQQTGNKRSVILSDFMESGRRSEELYNIIAHALQQHHIERVVAIGQQISSCLPKYLPEGIAISTFINTEAFLEKSKTADFQNETILVKGARIFRFERVVSLLETKIHQTRLEINLNALAHNLKQYQHLLQPDTKVMVMVKAFSYGSGSAEIANVLQFHRVHYLGVAYADEGLALRRNHITVPIMVMNADEESFASIIAHRLQPVLYTGSILSKFEQAVKAAGLNEYPVHLEIETGMNRLGFHVDEAEALGKYFQEQRTLKVESVFSHLVASEDPLQDAFTQEQADKFNQAIFLLKQHIQYPFLKHIANSAAIVRHPHLQWDMVRLGIGIYGIEISSDKLELLPVASLRSTIAQLKHLEPGDTVSYNRRGIVKEKSVIATVRIGYADGYSRRLGNGVGKMYVNGHLAPVVGTVCMDMTMIDVTHVPDVKEGDEVVIFGKELPVQQLAAWMDTIPYEVLTSVSQRVKRIYFHE